MDINYYEKLWGEVSKEDLERTKKLWDFRAEEFNRNYQSGFRKEKTLNPIDLFTGDLNKEESQVLDIGCGPGKYSIGFSKYVKHVIGIDISHKMIDLANDNKKAEKLTNADFMAIPWQEIDLDKMKWKNKFDLVFASMSPGISSMKDLKKMTDASVDMCFISSFVSRSDDIKDQLVGLVGRENKKDSRSTKIYYGFNILWELGYYPELTYHDVEWKRDYDFEEYLQKTILELNLSDQEEIGLIKEYLGKNMQDGKIHEHTRAKIAWMYWSVK